ncbi:programmed cell death protein 7-like [Camarhynchus parvulus]|uniref:programmed cell death protein 7-like n=1 Tax=Geospiza parvula TaxID=87175 RepID=UPI001237C031|nr:programmed cell death protein 7-like [Camarhynchus parvulus]
MRKTLHKRAVTSWQPRTAGSDPPIAQAFITCLGPGTPLPALPACPPRRGGAEGAGRGARGRCPLPTRPQPSELVTASGRRAGSPGCSRLLPSLPFRLPGRPPRFRPGRLPRDRIPPLTSRRRDPAPQRQRERQHSRDAVSTPAPPAASPPHGALSALRPAAPERSRPPQPRPASPLSPRRSVMAAAEPPRLSLG